MAKIKWKMEWDEDQFLDPMYEACCGHFRRKLLGTEDEPTRQEKIDWVKKTLQDQMEKRLQKLLNYKHKKGQIPSVPTVKFTIEDNG